MVLTRVLRFGRIHIMYIGKLLFHIISGFLGLWIAAKVVPGVEFYGTYISLLIMGIVLGLLNHFLKPILQSLSFPIKVLTLGLSSLVLNMAVIWLIEIIFPRELEITGLIPLFWTTLIVWGLNLFFGLQNKK